MRSRNLVATFASERAALAFVQTSILTHGHDYAECLALVLENGGVRSGTIVTGPALAARSEHTGIDHAGKATAADEHLVRSRASIDDRNLGGLA